MVVPLSTCLVELASEEGYGQNTSTQDNSANEGSCIKLLSGRRGWLCRGGHHGGRGRAVGRGSCSGKRLSSSIASSGRRDSTDISGGSSRSGVINCDGCAAGGGVGSSGVYGGIGYTHNTHNEGEGKK